METAVAAQGKRDARPFWEKHGAVSDSDDPGPKGKRRLRFKHN